MLDRESLGDICRGFFFWVQPEPIGFRNPDMKKILLALLLFPATAHSQLDSVFAYIDEWDTLNTVEQGLPCWPSDCPATGFHRWFVVDTTPTFWIASFDSIGLVNVQVVNPAGMVEFDTSCMCIDWPHLCEKFTYNRWVQAGSTIIVSAAPGTALLIGIYPMAFNIPSPPPIAWADTLCGAFSQPHEFDKPAKPLEAPAPVIDMRTFKPVRRENMVPWLDYKEFKKH